MKKNNSLYFSKKFLLISLLIIILLVFAGFYYKGITGNVALANYLNTNYAPPTDVFNNNASIFNISSGSLVAINDMVNLTVNVDLDGYIYKKGYIYNQQTRSWDVFSFDQTPVENSYWIRNTASKLLVINASNSLNNGENYIVAYACQKIDNFWKCGCQTADQTNCTKWMLHKFNVSSVVDVPETQCTDDANCSITNGTCVEGLCVSKGFCVADNSCIPSTCISTNCSDDCGNIYPGTKAPNCSCATNTFVGENCTSDCNTICPGTKEYGSVWVAKESPRYWMDVAMSADGKIQTAVEDDRLCYNRLPCSLGYIYISNDSGNTWIPMESSRTWSSVSMSSNGSIQVAVALWEGIYISHDYGKTWNQITVSLKNWKSVAMSSNGSVLAVVTSADRIYISRDFGLTWSSWAPSGPYLIWNDVAMSADGTKITAVAQDGPIYFSTNSGNTWSSRESTRNWKSVAMSADGTKQTAVAYGDKIYISNDSGNTWSPIGSSKNWNAVAMSADGKIQTASAFVYNERIYVSTDYGNTWNPQGLPSYSWRSLAMSADGKIQTAAVSNGLIYVSS